MPGILSTAYRFGTTFSEGRRRGRQAASKEL